jgi:recombination protein RecA
VDSNKKRRLETTITTLQERWGSKAIGRLKVDQIGGIAHVSTGFPALDEALAIGGLPRGRISELNGIPSSGMATIALKLVANAQAQKSMAIYIDLDQSFDPDYATRCGLVLEQLVLVRPHGIPQALAILQDIILGAEADILVFDTPLSLLSETQSAQALATTLGRLIAPLGRAQGVLLFLISLPANSTPDPTGKPVNSTLAHFATVRLFIQRERWTYQQQDINGYQAQVLVTKNKLGPAGKQASIRVVFYDAGGSENGDSEDGSLEDDATAGDVR